MICCFALGAIPAELGSRHSIATSRSPVFVSTEESASLAYRVDNTYIDSRLVGILEIEPLRDDAEVPVGLTQWLKPGHIAISQSAVPLSNTLERQFGEIQEIIDDAVILDDEIVVYYRPSNGKAFIDLAREAEGVYFASTFAKDADEGALFGDITYEQWSELLLPAVIVIFSFPLILNFRTTRASVEEVLSRERFVLESIGAPRRQLIQHSVSHLYKPYLVGIGLATVVIVVVTSGYVPVPFTGFHLHPNIYIDNLALFAAYLLFASTIAFAYLAWPSTHDHRSYANKHWSLNTRTGLALFAFGIILVIIMRLFWRKIPNDLAMPLLMLVVLFVLLGLHSTLAVLCTLLTNVLLKQRSVDLRTDLFFRWVINHPFKASRTGTFAGGFITIGIMLFALFGLFAESQVPPADPPGGVQIVKTSLNCSGDYARCLDDAASAITSKDPALAVYVATMDQGFAEISAGKVDQTTLQNVVEQELIPEYGTQRSKISLESRWAWIYTISEQRADLLELVQSIKFDTAMLSPTIVAGENGRAIAQIYRQQATWLTLFTTLGFIYAMVSVWIQYARETSAHAREFASIASLTGKADVIARETSMRHASVNIVAGIASLALGMFLSSQILFTIGGFSSLGFIVGIGVIYLAFVLSQTILMYMLVKKEAASWLPGKS